MIQRVKRFIAEWRLGRARRRNARLRGEVRREVAMAVQPTAFSNKSITQLKKLVRRANRKGHSQISLIAQQELRRRLALGELAKGLR